MFAFLIILLLLWFVVPFLYRRLQPWLTRWLIRRATRYAARQAGFNMDDSKRKSSNKKSRRSNHYREDTLNNGPIIPKEYAEDVEFTEIHDFSSATIINEETDSKGNRRSSETETQVSDAEIIEISRSEKNKK